MKIQLDIPLQYIEHIIRGAYIGYWARMHIGRALRYTIEELPDGESNPRVFQIGPARIQRALFLMSSACPQHLPGVLTGRGDNTVGDALVQLACFGELKYG